MSNMYTISEEMAPKYHTIHHSFNNGKIVAPPKTYNTSTVPFHSFLQQVLDDLGFTICWIGHINRMQSAPSGLLKGAHGMSLGQSKVFLEELYKENGSKVDRSASALYLWSNKHKFLDLVNDKPTENAGRQVINSLIDRKVGFDDIARETGVTEQTLKAVIFGTYRYAPYRVQMKINSYMEKHDKSRGIPYPHAEELLQQLKAERYPKKPSPKDQTIKALTEENKRLREQNGDFERRLAQIEEMMKASNKQVS